MIASVFSSLWDALRWTWHDPDGYNFISGPLADITLLGGAYAIFRRHNCHAKGCWRIGRHAVAGTGYIVCRKHHPHATPTAEEILAQHRNAMYSAASPGTFGVAGHPSDPGPPDHPSHGAAP